ncbi:flagellar protein FlaG [Ferrimonas marina]|uniref:flagellar protein FlaG n=1 Tax=Ferrimonas marina TaxID=299255 RepID=UPI00093346E8|nr:flagellar protein FlaG [Ferrimonas marina]
MASNTPAPARSSQETTAVVAKDAVQSMEKGVKADNPALDQERLNRIAEELERFVSGNQRALSFHVDDASGRDVVVVRDTHNDQVIRQIPAEEVLELAARLSDLTGVLIETQV